MPVQTYTYEPPPTTEPSPQGAEPAPSTEAAPVAQETQAPQQKRKSVPSPTPG